MKVYTRMQFYSTCWHLVSHKKRKALKAFFFVKAMATTVKKHLVHFYYCKLILLTMYCIFTKTLQVFLSYTIAALCLKMISKIKPLFNLPAMILAALLYVRISSICHCVVSTQTLAMRPLLAIDISLIFPWKFYSNQWFYGLLLSFRLQPSNE